MVGRTGSWADFTQRPAGGRKPDHEEPLSELTLRLFGSADGKAWLARMFERKFMQTQTGGSDFLEGQREALREIDRLMAEARADLDKKTRDRAV